MWYLATWNKCFIGVSDSKKDLEIYVRNIRGLSEKECQIEVLSDDSIDMFGDQLSEQGLFLTEYDGVFLPQAILEIIAYDLHKWVTNVRVLSNLLIEFTRLTVNSKTIKEKEEIDTLLEAIRIVSRISDDGEDVFNGIADKSFLSHPVLTCKYDEYVKYLDIRDAFVLYNKEFKEKIDLPYT